MKKIAIIPLRSGSKGIPSKNKKKLLGRPLYQWVLTEAIFSDLDEVFVFTDDIEILDQVKEEYYWTDKVKGMLRSPESSTDFASTEKAMLEFSNKIDNQFEIICLLQATSPLTNSKDINECIQKIEKGNFDSVLTVVETKRFIWSEDGASLNYDYNKRPRRQDFDGLLVENGAVYAAKKDTFLSGKNRIGDHIGLVKMPEDTLTEIDEPNDWVIAERILQNRLMRLKKHLKPIKVMVFDVDGVFTDGRVAVSDEKELFKEFSLRDGMGFEILKDVGILPIIMTSENSSIITTRMQKLKIKHVFMGVRDKFSILNKVLLDLDFDRNQVAYVGDDINDLSNILSVSWGITPSDALLEIKICADLILNNTGGHSAIREAIQFIIKYNQKF